MDNAAAIIIAHNHPSGSLEPSADDKETTRRIKQAGDIIGIKVLDHIIVAPSVGYYSFVEAGIF
jgi:DNA repair protein RadC